MDLDDFRSILEGASVDVWELIDAAIAVASIDDSDELKRRRDGIVERLYTATSAPPPCPNCEPENNGGIDKAEAEAEKEDEDEDEDEELDPFGGLFDDDDDEQKKIREIKQQLESPNQSEESLMELLQILDDMDITFQALEDTDIGRHVNLLRKHSSNDVRRLVKLLVSKWKGIVDDWVMKSKTPGQAVTDVMADEDSPEHKTPQNEHHQSPDFARSPNPHNGNSGSGVEPKSKAIPRKEAPQKATPPPSNPAPQKRQREQRDSNFDAEKLASARKRLQENYKEAANAKKQRTIQVMDLHELPKPKSKNAFFSNNKGGIGSNSRSRW